MMPEPNAALSIDELADSEKAGVHNLTHPGSILAQKVARYWRFSNLAINGWLKSTENHAAGDGGAG